MIEDARKFALAAHGGQMYGVHPYSVHLDAVAELVEKYVDQHGDELRAIAYLHDVVEDTETTLDAIEERFGKLVADCVAILTDEPGENRQERKRKTYAKMAEVSGDKELALIVKAADRLANMLACVADEKTELLNVYKDEHPAFQKAAERKELCFSLWYEMDKIVHSHQHGGFNYQFWDGDYGLVRRRTRYREQYHPEVVRLASSFPKKKRAWATGSPAVTDAITGMGEDLWSSGGEWATKISLEKAAELAAELGIGLFDEGR